MSHRNRFDFANSTAHAASSADNSILAGQHVAIVPCQRPIERRIERAIDIPQVKLCRLRVVRPKNGGNLKGYWYRLEEERIVEFIVYAPIKKESKAMADMVSVELIAPKWVDIMSDETVSRGIEFLEEADV